MCTAQTIIAYIVSNNLKYKFWMIDPLFYSNMFKVLMTEA